MNILGLIPIDTEYDKDEAWLMAPQSDLKL